MFMILVENDLFLVVQLISNRQAVDGNLNSRRVIATMQNRFLKLDIFSISVLLDLVFATDISGTDRFR